ncbi:hypothetical protein GCM10022248_30760 [Nonomuraea soli]
MKITLDTRIQGSLGLMTLQEAVAHLRARDLTCLVDPVLLDGKVAVFTECVEHGYTPLRSEIMAAYFVAERDAAQDAFDGGLITEGELRQKLADLSRQLLS